MKRYLLLPFTLTPLLLVGTFTLGWVIAIRARFTGVLLGIILFSWFFKYCFAFLDAIIAGAEEPPVMSVEMVNPLNEQRPLVLFALLLLDSAAITFLGQLSRTLSLAAAGALIALLPAQVAVLSITSIYRMVWPPTLARLIGGWGINYLWLCLATLACAGALYELWQSSSSVAFVAAGSQLAFLTMFAIIGGAVHEHRFALGVETLTRTEREQARREREQAAARGAMLDHSYALVRLGRTAEAWAAIEKWLAEHCGDERGFTEYPALLETTARWDTPLIADRLADRYLGWLLRRGENGLAVDVLEQRLAANSQFRPAAARERLRLAELSALAGKGALSRLLRQTNAGSGSAPPRVPR